MFLVNSRYPRFTATPLGFNGLLLPNRGTPFPEVTVLICLVP